MGLNEAPHIKGGYVVQNKHIFDTYGQKSVVNPAILLDLHYGCVHRIDEEKNLRRDYSKLMQRLQYLGEKYTRHVVPITYDCHTQEASWNFDEQNKMYLSVDEACTLMNFITTCGNRPDEIRRVLLADNVAIHGHIDELQAAGF